MPEDIKEKDDKKKKVTDKDKKELPKESTPIKDTDAIEKLNNPELWERIEKILKQALVKPK